MASDEGAAVMEVRLDAETAAAAAAAAAAAEDVAAEEWSGAAAPVAAGEAADQGSPGLGDDIMLAQLNNNGSLF